MEVVAPPRSQDPRRAEVALERATDVAVALMLVGFAAHVLSRARRMFFMLDDWGLLHQGQRWGGLLEPYNDHLSIWIVGIYRLLVEMFGLSYLPFRVVALCCFLGVPLSWYITTRGRLSPPLAAAGALALIVVPAFEIQPSTLNHFLVGIGAVVCAWALREDRAGWLAGGLMLALSGAAGGVAVAAACAVHCACTRAPRSTWIATAVPGALWAVWFLTRGESSSFQPTQDPTAAEALRYARNIALSPLDVGRLDPLLIAGFVVVGVSALRGGLRSGATWISWSTALLVWSAGLASERGAQGTVDVYGRYQLLALVFVLLALVPARPLQLSIRWRWAAVTGLLVLVVVAANEVAGRSEAQGPLNAIGSGTRCRLAHGDDLRWVVGATPDEVTELRDRYWSVPSAESVEEHCQLAQRR
jgi:hypothetical protein